MPYQVLNPPGSPNFNYTTREGFCPAVNRSLEQLFGAGAGQAATANGFLQSLLSPINLGAPLLENITQTVTGNNLRQVQGVRRHRTPISAVSSQTNPDFATCNYTANYNPGPLQEIYTIDEWVGARFRINESNLRELCEDTADSVAKEIRGALDAIVTQVNRRLISIALASAFGVYANGATSATFDYIETGATTVPDTYEQARLLREFNNVTGQIMPIHVGGPNLYDYTAMIRTGCCNTGGLLVDAYQAKSYFFYDTQMDAILGTNNTIVYAPGLMQVIQWFEFTPDTFVEEKDEVRGRIIDPATLLPLEIHMVKDRNCKVWDVVIGTYFTLAYNPKPTYAPGDVLPVNANGILRAIIT
jgi:hypothetical protein